MAKEAPFAVEVPAADQDKPAWVKVGVIAAVGFVIGIAWPRLVGVRLGPSAPGEAAAAAASASASAHAGRAPESPPPASVAAKAASPAVAAVASASAAPAAASNAMPPAISVQKGTVVSCKTSDGETKKGKDCGTVPGVDQLVTPRVRKIATCSGVEGQTGKLNLVVHADFDSGRFWYDVAKSSSLPNMDAVTACLKTSFHGTSTTATPHEHARYVVSYNATFAPGTGAASDEDKATAKKSDKDKSERGAKEAPAEDKTEKVESAPASGEAAVAWEVALVRDAPKTGTLVSRLPRGTKVKVGTAKDGWFQIKFGDGFANEGWVYRGAIGR